MLAYEPWIDPVTGEHIASFDSERAGRLRERARADAAEARVRQLEAQLHQQDR